MSNGGLGLYLNSTFTLSSSAAIPDTAYTGISETFIATSNSPNSTYAWNYGDLATDSGDTTMHTYITPGVVNAQVIISTGGCTDTINQTVVVLPTDGEFYISTKDQNEKMIVVTDVLGQIVYSEMRTGNKISLNIAGQKPGIYFIEVRDTVTGKAGVKKMILQ
jgi:PKD repeat protein